MTVTAAMVMRAAAVLNMSASAVLDVVHCVIQQGPSADAERVGNLEQS